MATNIAHVRVTPVEAGGGYLIRCSSCQLHTVRPFRHEADELAAGHQRAHVGGTPAAQHQDAS